MRFDDPAITPVGHHHSDQPGTTPGRISRSSVLSKSISRTFFMRWCSGYPRGPPLVFAQGLGCGREEVILLNSEVVVKVGRESLKRDGAESTRISQHFRAASMVVFEILDVIAGAPCGPSFGEYTPLCALRVRHQCFAWARRGAGLCLGAPAGVTVRFVGEFSASFVLLTELRHFADSSAVAVLTPLRSLLLQIRFPRIDSSMCLSPAANPHKAIASTRAIGARLSGISRPRARHRTSVPGSTADPRRRSAE